MTSGGLFGPIRSRLLPADVTAGSGLDRATAKNGPVGKHYEYFAAADDNAATAMLEVAWPPPTFRDEMIRLDDLAELEELLTGRSVQEIMADPRFAAEIAVVFNEEAGVVECGILAVTDTLTRALTAPDLPTMPAAWDYLTDALPELAAVARHAVAHAHHMYCFWWY
jgi:hypothetical protein